MDSSASTVPQDWSLTPTPEPAFVQLELSGLDQAVSLALEVKFGWETIANAQQALTGQVQAV